MAIHRYMSVAPNRNMFGVCGKLKEAYKEGAWAHAILWDVCLTEDLRDPLFDVLVGDPEVVTLSEFLGPATGYAVIAYTDTQEDVYPFARAGLVERCTLVWASGEGSRFDMITVADMLRTAGPVAERLKVSVECCGVNSCDRRCILGLDDECEERTCRQVDGKTRAPASMMRALWTAVDTRYGGV